MSTCFFDPRTIDRDPVCTLLPAGSYLVSIKRAVCREDNKGKKLRMFYEVVQPETVAGLCVMDTLNIGNSSATAERIAQEQLAKILDCVNRGNQELAKPSDIEGLVLCVDVGLEPHWKETHLSQNYIVKYKPFIGQDPSKFHTDMTASDPVSPIVDDDIGF